jgi:hypothetical protein
MSNESQVVTTALAEPKLPSFDGIESPDEEDTYHGYLGSTSNDRSDMNRMGKIQELRVVDQAFAG